MAPARRSAWWMIAVFFVVAALSYTDRLILSLLVDPIRAELRLTDTQLGVLQGLAFAIVYAFAGLPFGRLADVFPRRNVIIAGVVIWSLATFGGGLAPGFGGLLVSRLFVGIGEAAFAPAAVSMIADRFEPERRGFAIGWLLTGMAVGSASAIILGGGLLQLAEGGAFASVPGLEGLSPWRVVLIALGAAGIVPVALLLTVPETDRSDEDRREATLSETLAVFRGRWPLLASLYVGVAVVTAADFSLQSWAPALLMRRFAFSPGEVASTLGPVSLAVGALGTLAGGYLSDRAARTGGDRRRLSVGLVALTVGCVGCAIGFAATAPLALAMFACWALASSVSETVGITTLQNVIPSRVRGVGTSLVSFFNVILGLGAGTALTGVITDRLYGDPAAVGLSMTTVMMPAAILGFLLFLAARGRLDPSRMSSQTARAERAMGANIRNLESDSTSGAR